jgi:hypothetical protein
VVSGIRGPTATGFAAASHVGWWIVFGCGLAVLALGLLTTGRWARGTAERTAASLPLRQASPAEMPGLPAAAE